MRFAWRDLRSSGRFLWVFWASLMLGVTLVAASGGLFRQVSTALLADARALFGGDVRVETRAPLDPATLAWLRERGDVSLLIELRTMMMANGRPQLVELQSVDERYPLYGEVALAPRMTVTDAVSSRDGVWGAALDPVLAARLGAGVGDTVEIGYLAVEVRALIERQPDRALSADWRGPPVLVAAELLEPSGLIGPGSRLDYEYRVRVPGDASAFAESVARTFPDAAFQVRTFEQRRERMSEVLGQVASGLLLIGLSALLVGGIGVFNSVRAYLDSKLATIATLRSLGLRESALAGVYIAQVLALATSAAAAGCVAGALLALAGTSAVADRLPVAPAPALLLPALVGAALFGVLIALTFALPAIGRALSVSPAALFRGIDAAAVTTPPRWWRACALAGGVTALLVLAALPQPLFGAAFLACAGLVLVLLEGVVRAVRGTARRLAGHPIASRQFALRFAVTGLCRPGAPLRVTLLSLGSALTVLVASTIVAVALLETIDETLPERAPALVLYDVADDQLGDLRAIAAEETRLRALDLAPLVLGRLSHVNGEPLGESADARRVLESRDEHKLSHRGLNIDGVTVTRGAWWPEDHSGPPLVAFEDREADQLGLEVGDLLRFEILGSPVEASLAAIYSQRGIGTRFWFEGVFSDGVLEPFVSRHVGTAHLPDDAAVALEARIAAAMPNVVMIRTERLLAEARAMLGRAAAGLSVIIGVTLLASVLVLASVLAAGRTRQIYEATVLHTVGARLGAIRTSLTLELMLIAVLTAVFAIVFGSAIAGALLHLRLKLDAGTAWWIGAGTALALSALCMGLGARALLAHLRIAPARLLRSSG